MNLKRSENSNFHRSSSDKNLVEKERRLSRTTLNNSSSTISDLNRCERLSFLSWDRLTNWIHSIVVINFDLKIGHSIEYLINIGGSLTEKEKIEVSYLSMPDTNGQCIGDLQYHFRLFRQQIFTEKYSKYNFSVPNTLRVDDTSLFGYVNFRQVQDKTSKRGYFQKSFVILSRLPFFSLLSSLAYHLSVIYFQSSQEVFESSLRKMNSEWSPIEVGNAFILKIHNQIIQTRIPTRGEKPFSSEDLLHYRTTVQESLANNEKSKYLIDDDTDFEVSMDANRSMTSNKVNQQIPQLIPFVHDVNTYRALSAVLNHVQLLWELVLVNEPIVILSRFPNDCSQTVQALVHMIWPLHYAADCRPFLTIHNLESIETKNEKVRLGRIVGVTNPLFSRMLQQWPHLIRIDDGPKQSSSSPTTVKEKFILIDHDEDELSLNEVEESLELSLKKTTNNEEKQMPIYSKIYKRTKTSSNPTELRPGLHTCYKQLLSSDKIILKKLYSSKAHQRPDAVQNALLRRFFLELTQSFINPLERYFSSLLPVKTAYRIEGAVPTLKSFSQDEFFKSLEQNGPQLTSGLRGSWKELYKNFFNSENFHSWFVIREREAKSKIFLTYLETIVTPQVQQDFRWNELNPTEKQNFIEKLESFIERLEFVDDDINLHIDQIKNQDFIEKLKFMIRQINKS